MELNFSYDYSKYFFNEKTDGLPLGDDALPGEGIKPLQVNNFG